MDLFARMNCLDRKHYQGNLYVQVDRLTFPWFGMVDLRVQGSQTRLAEKAYLIVYCSNCKVCVREQGNLVRLTVVAVVPRMFVY